MRKKKIEGDKEVDLAALVDIFSNMLFFLLTTVAFLQLKTLNAAVPALSSGPVSTGKSVDVSVEIRADGLSVSATGEAADASVGKVSVKKTLPRIACTDVDTSRGFCPLGQRLDTKELTKELWEIKKKAPETKNILIFPEAGTQFAEIILVMDATREMPSMLDPNKKVPLFSRPVLSELVTGTETARED